MNPAQLKAIFPNSKIMDFLPFWDEVADYAKINTPNRVAMFLAQVGHECQGFKRFDENLNYSASRLAIIFPDRYAVSPKELIKVPNQLAEKIANKPELIANFTYANRLGNGGPESGDGFRYRGRGPIMTTGFVNYKAVDSEFVLEGKLSQSPETLLLPEWGLKATAFFWKKKNLNVFADQNDIRGARKRINGGFIGLDDVTKLHQKVLTIL